MDKNLIDYIKQTKKQGFSDEQIKKALLDAGWKEGDIKEGLKSIKKPTFLKTKLPGWVFVLAMIVAAAVVVLIAWQSFVILAEIH